MRLAARGLGRSREVPQQPRPDPSHQSHSGFGRIKPGSSFDAFSPHPRVKPEGTYFARKRYSCVQTPRSKQRRHKNVSQNHNAAQFPSSNRPAGLRENSHCDGPVLSVPDPQPPAPRGHQDRAYSRGTKTPRPLGTGESWSFFFCETCLFCLFWEKSRCLICASGLHHARKRVVPVGQDDPETTILPGTTILKD